MNEHDLYSEIRSKVDIVDVVSSYLPLTQKGKNFFGVCPFHDDTNPSMSVSRDLQIYRCFSCGASGNVFNFVMNYEHISFKEALSLLAKRAGVELKGFKIKESVSKNAPLYTIYELAHKFYQNNLNTSYGKEAKAYLKGRGINEDVIKEFEIGLSLKESTLLKDLMLKKGYDLKTLHNLGLVSDDHDTYINRIMFPLHDLEGKVVGFSGRIYDNSNLNKYLNTKETPLFKKGQLLYHYHIAREEVRIKKQVIVMEGFMDVIRASTIGVKNTVALMGTAMTKEQANLIKRLSNDIILCFDGDDAGRHATLVNGDHFVSLGITPKVISLNNDYDPDTYILEKGGEHFQSLIENAISYNDYKIKVLKEGVNLNSEEEVASYIHQVILEASKWNDEIKQEIVLKKLAKEFDMEYNTLEKRLLELTSEKNKESKPSVKESSLPPPKRKNKYDQAILALLYYMLKSDKVVTKCEKEGLFFPLETERVLFSEISYYYKKYGIMNVADFYTYLKDKEELKSLLSQVLAQELNDEVDKNEIDLLFQVVREYNVKEEVNRLQKKIKEEMDPLEKAKIAERIRKLRIGS